MDIATLLPGDELTGGYILKVDKFTGDFEGLEFTYPTVGGADNFIQFHKPGQTISTSRWNTSKGTSPHLKMRLQGGLCRSSAGLQTIR